MNILIPHNWLLEYLKTNLKPNEIAAKLSLSSVSVEKVERVPSGLVDGQEYVYDIEVTPNRPDLLSVIGIAREGAAVLGNKCFLPKSHKIAVSGNILPLNIIIKEPDLCPRYLGIVLQNVRVGPSPDFIKERLKLSGLRPINNVVDITNYVMLEYGQPLHAFDLDLLEKNKKGEAQIIVRKAKKGEKIISLDQQKFDLKSNMLVIADFKEPVAIAGIKGGVKAEVTEKTKNIVLECANFNPISIRKTSHTLGLQTDASVRFDKGLAPLGLEIPFQRTVALLDKCASAEVASKPVDVYPQKTKSKEITFHFSTIKWVLGEEIPPKECIRILEKLGFKTKKSKGRMVIDVPYWRHNDIEREEDFVEEVARIYGYHKLKGRLLNTKIPEELRPQEFWWEDKAKDILVSQGFVEVYNYSFVSRELLEKFGLDYKKHLRLNNPLSQEFEYMRRELLPNLLEVVLKNQKRFPNMRLFEFSNVYQGKEVPFERRKLSGVVVREGAKIDLFYEVKGILENLLRELGVTNFKFQKSESQYFDQTAQSEIQVQDKSIGIFGLIDSHLSSNFQIKSKISAFDLDFNTLLSLVSKHKTYEPIPKYPAIELDLSVVVSEQTLWGDLKVKVRKVSSLIRKVELFDVYWGKAIASGKKSLAFRVTYRSPKRSLAEEEAKEIHKQVVAELKKKFGVVVREK